MDISDYTPERCEELERAYWKTLTYAAPLYGADMMGTLFDDRTDIWNLNKLPNLLDVLGTKVPGVNTAYLYLGMWKATFAWHLEDVDLYSINYLHFGAPKQWYSISQADARRFEAAMKNVWPADAKACDQFLRHKGFLISPHHLLSHYGIKVNKVVSYPGEFVVTYPYGYHSGYNLGYNCAEAVNFALDSWLPMGKIAKKCECAQAQDSVWINVYEIERKLRGEETEYEETEDEDEDDEDMSGLPTPPASHGVKFKDGSRKRKRGPGGKDKIKVKKVKLRLKTRAEPPCCLCPHDISGLELLPTEDGRKAHRLCALYMPETYIDSVDDSEVVCSVNGIHKDRLDLKCLLCRSKRGACFQCSHNKCARAYHATCAAAAGCFVEEQDVPVFGEDGTEFKEQAFDFSCRFHRTRRDKKHNADVLEADGRVRAAATSLQKGEIRQFQYLKGEIFAGIVVENREEDETVLINVLPTRYRRSLSSLGEVLLTNIVIPLRFSGNGFYSLIRQTIDFRRHPQRRYPYQRHARPRTSSTPRDCRRTSPGKTTHSSRAIPGPNSWWNPLRTRARPNWTFRSRIKFGTTWGRRQPTRRRSTPKTRPSRDTMPRVTTWILCLSPQSLPSPRSQQLLSNPWLRASNMA